MTETEVSVKTIAEVNQNTGTFTITCFSDMNASGTTTPSIFKSQLPTDPKTIDNVDVKEGELALSYEGETAGEISEGQLIINPTADDPNKYSIQDQDLIYTE